jgi:hypothetical protein
MKVEFDNPFKPGAGHKPPYLAGRNDEKTEFRRLLKQNTILENAIITGLRGVGKTVLLEELKPLAIGEQWLWVGNDLSESASLNEENIALRLISDLSSLTSAIRYEIPSRKVGFGVDATAESNISFQVLQSVYHDTPGLVSDKLKAVLEFAWSVLSATNPDKRGVIFAYDEAQNLSDHAVKDQFPLSLLLDVFQSIQRKGIPFMLLLSGLPTLFPKLVDARTFAERMFKIIFLEKLSEKDSIDAIKKPIEAKKCPVSFKPGSIKLIVNYSGGYPYFIQFICREVYDILILRLTHDMNTDIAIEPILRKLDRDFFAGRWAKVTDRQRELLTVIAESKNGGTEFSVQEAVEASKQLDKSFSNSHVNQMLNKLIESGIIYKNRHGRYSFAVPFLDKFIIRQKSDYHNI